MKYDVVQQSLEEFVQANWTCTAVQFDNVAFNTDLYSEFAQFSIVFGDAKKTTVTNGCYRQMGVVFFTIYSKPALGTQRLLELAATAASMFLSKVVQAVAPLTAPRVTLAVPDLMKDLREQDGWVRAQLSTPFFYDIVEI